MDTWHSRLTPQPAGTLTLFTHGSTYGSTYVAIGGHASCCTHALLMDIDDMPGVTEIIPGAHLPNANDPVGGNFDPGSFQVQKCNGFGKFQFHQIV